ncbi:MAG TPA: hypothetical protein DCO79_11635 [Spirochaeta sp.]|nr:hypothetical protein [Spirochaeta sp.]
MDFRKEYHTALDLASALRYEEAREKLKRILSEHPDKTEALILLGKVEYYQRLFDSSRRCFEMVLTRDPRNFEAYYGLQFFLERKRRKWNLAAWIASLILIVTACIILSFSMRSYYQQYQERVEILGKQFDSLHSMELQLVEQIHKMSDIQQVYSNNLLTLKEEMGGKIDNFELRQVEWCTELENIQSDRYRALLVNLEEISTMLEERATMVGDASE